MSSFQRILFLQVEFQIVLKMHEDTRRSRTIEVGVDERLHLACSHTDVSADPSDVVFQSGDVRVHGLPAIGMKPYKEQIANNNQAATFCSRAWFRPYSRDEPYPFTGDSGKAGKEAVENHRLHFCVGFLDTLLGDTIAGRLRSVADHRGITVSAEARPTHIRGTRAISLDQGYGLTELRMIRRLQPFEDDHLRRDDLRTMSLHAPDCGFLVSGVT